MPNAAPYLYVLLGSANLMALSVAIGSSTLEHIAALALPQGVVVALTAGDERYLAFAILLSIGTVAVINPSARTPLYENEAEIGAKSRPSSPPPFRSGSSYRRLAISLTPLMLLLGWLIAGATPLTYPKHAMFGREKKTLDIVMA